MPPISVVVITKNEEKNIRRCLESVIEIADEMLVVDSYSEDKTAEIAVSLGAVVVKQNFLGHIEQKNFAARQAKNDWVLSLDADEALDSELKENIKTFINHPKSNVCSMNRLTNYCGTWIRHTGWYPDRKLRLWNRKFGQWGGVNPHDSWFPTNNSEKITHLKGDILHYSYYTISDHIKQIETFTEIAAKAEVSKGKRVSLITVLVAPVLKFCKHYFLQLGFLDGFYGYVISRLSAEATFIKYLKIWQHNKSK